ncbi:hypothetical protein HGI59_06625 [Clostridium saccharobutylicum]|nr:hypothetical protein [Clostridium saccharobutylicum]MBC2412881.1 hypothetical protein [Clostridium saccharobutylicum]MBC2437083.1 hypothetical protein [Clostridium saccharobutylicum]MBC2440039.1 hypothetical protein [Clostridium saccharobutylicum]MBC2444789.1 hypothetical protein [Clostridium saccharobutylicum]
MFNLVDNFSILVKYLFKLSVQTTSDQHLIQKGFYLYIRNPAYTGSILIKCQSFI